MCGIAGYISKRVIDNIVLHRMTDSIAHRGPDGEGHYFRNNFAFGHRRLAIFDLTERGKQPMHYQERYVITFNGEIYNHIEIKEELFDAGYRFNSETDTEIIMAAFDFWGVDCLSRFNGMWAFVIYDKVKKNFFISRDRFGKKPLYYYMDDEKFVFCSEVKGLYASGIVRKKPNIEYLEEYLKNGPIDFGENTAFKDVFRFPFAHYFLGTADQLLLEPKFIRYWELKVNTSKERFVKSKADGYAKKYYDLLSDSVKLRLRADVKIGSALSGGLDSSSIVYLINQQLKELGREELQETFSSVYKSDGTQDCDESEYIDLLAKELGVNSNQIEPNEDDVARELEKVIWNMETPPESTCMSGWHTFKKVKDTGLTVTLDGQGADEQLAGYFYYIASYLTSISIVDLYKEFFSFLKIPGAKRVLFISFFLAHFRLFFGESIYRKVFARVKGREAPGLLNEELKLSIEKSLVTLIHYSDHVSMGHSIESRMPFMDYRLVEFLAQVPACYKMHNGWTKYLARLAFDKKLPDQICWRKDKMGWPIPETYWFQGNLKGFFENSIEDSSLLKRFQENENPSKWLKNEINVKLGIRRLNLSILDNLFWKDK